jgi:hypothetical protein
MNSDDAIDQIEVEGALPLFGVTEIVGVSEFDADAGSAEAEQDAEQSDTDDESLKVKRRTDQFFASAADYYDCEDDTTSTLATASSDSKHSRAFKTVLSAATRKRDKTYSGLSAMVVFAGDHATSAPALCDWLADICLAAKARLSPAAYQVFSACFEADFQNWTSVPQVLREHIMARVGRELLRRHIVNERGNVNEYFQQRGGSLLQRTRFAKGWR